jgi:steroid 5-alpha reductase family enzyme
MIFYFLLILILFTYVSFWFLLSVIKQRNDIADVAWGLGFVTLAWSSYFLAVNYNSINLIVNLLVSLWGFRLAIHIYYRNRGKSEDYRYLNWRSEWGSWFYLRSYLQVFLLQGVFLFLVSLPVLILNKNAENNFNLLMVFGLLIWLMGFIFESVSDKQLSDFKKDPKNKGKLIRSGLWNYSRHPNYFGEVVQWWGIWLIALNFQYGLFGIIGPLTITFLILKVSGIPLLEKKMAENPDFLDYKKTTSVFLPLPFKKK